MELSRKRILAISLFALAIPAFCIVSWLKTPYGFSPQRQIATAFISCINAGDFEKAFELTQKNQYTGKTPEEFKNKAFLEIRGSGYRFAYAHPPQTNGNRLRRRLKGVEVEMREVSLEFRGPSDLRITLRHSGDNQWKIFFITTHAG